MISNPFDISIDKTGLNAVSLFMRQSQKSVEIVKNNILQLINEKGIYNEKIFFTVLQNLDLSEDDFTLSDWIDLNDWFNNTVLN